MKRRGRKSNVLGALIRRETSCRRINDHNLLLAYAEDSSVMSCYQMKECELPGSPRSTFLVCFSPDKTKMASSHGDHTVRIVDCKTFKCINTLRGHPRTPWCIAFHPSSDQLLASGCLGGQVRVWNLKTGDSEVYTPPDKAVIASLAFHPTDHVLLIATSNKLFFWSWDQPEPFACIQTASAEEKVRLVAFSPLGDHILTAVTNIVPQTAANPTTFAPSRSSAVNRLIQSIGNSRAGGDQFAAYVLRPSASNNSSSSTPASTDSDPIPETTSVASVNSPRTTVDSNTEPVTRGGEATSNSINNETDVTQMDITQTDVTQAGVRQNDVTHNDFTRTDVTRTDVTQADVTQTDVTRTDSTQTDVTRTDVTRNDATQTDVTRTDVTRTNVTQTDVTDSGNQDYRGVFAIFRARDNNTWNFDVTSEDNASTNTLLEQDANTNSVTFESDSNDEPSGVSMSLTAGNTDVYSDAGDVTLQEQPVNSDSVEQSVPFSSQYFSTVSSEAAPASEEAGDRVVGVGRVINVGPGSSRTSYLAHGSNHSSSFATLSGSQGPGTAVATATARTFRHVHTAVVVADGTNGGPQFALRTAINRAIAGAFAGCGEGAVASNIINTTHRLQWWDFSQVKLPDLKNSESHVIAPSCKIHNDASCDISNDGKLLATFVPSAQGFPDDGVVAVYSLEKDTLGQCIFTKKFGPNAISISLSPLSRYIMVGLAARRLHWHLTSRQMVAQIFRLTDKDSPSDSVKPVVSVMHECEAAQRSHVSVNAAFFHPLVGSGLVYGTNRGHLHMRQFGPRSTSRY